MYMEVPGWENHAFLWWIFQPCLITGGYIWVWLMCGQEFDALSREKKQVGGTESAVNSRETQSSAVNSGNLPDNYG